MWMGWNGDGLMGWMSEKRDRKKEEKKMLLSHMDVCRAMQRDAMP
jgi:hypothetical protein